MKNAISVAEEIGGMKSKEDLLEKPQTSPKEDTEEMMALIRKDP